MRFVIVGYGRVGRQTAALLEQEHHRLVVVENDPEKADKARVRGLAVVEGDGTREEVLLEAGLDEADAIAAMTGDVNANRTICLVGKEHGCRTVIRLSEDFQKSLYERFTEDVDDVIYPERVGAAGAKTALLGGDFGVLADLTEELSVAAIEVPEGSPLIGQRVVGVELPGEARIYAHGRADEAMTLPLPRTEIEAGDQLAITVAPDNLELVRGALAGEEAT